MRDWILISETFTTVQGEGPSAGTPAFFLRLGGCNQHCTWCDTPYTWVFDDRHRDMHQSGEQFNPMDELFRMSLYAIVQKVYASNCRLTVITGGEPLLQLDALSMLISQLNEEIRRNFVFEIETAGSIHPGELTQYDNVTFNVSPKLAHSGNPLELRRNIEALVALQSRGKAVFKFVVDHHLPEKEQLDEINEIIALAKIPAEKVWLMPCGTDWREIQHGLQCWVGPAMRNGWNITGRLQIEIWGDKRGT